MFNFSTKHLDQLTLEAKFSFKPTSSSLYGALGDNLPVNTTVLPTPTPPHQPLAPAPAQHHATPTSTASTVTPPKDPPTPYAVPSYPSPNRPGQTASLPQGAKKSTNIDSNQANAHRRSSLKTVSQKKSRQASGRGKSRSVREHRAGSSNYHYRKIAPKPDHRRKEKAERAKSGSPSAGACATPGFRMIRPRPQVAGS